MALVAASVRLDGRLHQDGYGGAGMTRALAITKRQAKTLIKAATEGNAVVEVETEIGIVRLIPAALIRKEKLDDEPKGHF